MRAVVAVWLGVMVGLGGCRRETKVEEVWRLLEGGWVEGWSAAGFEGEGEVGVKDGVMWLGEGAPMSGMVWKSWSEKGLPLVDYVVEYEAMRVRGDDFFGTVTFPVEVEGQWVSFVLGGWGGGRIGVSSVDNLDASGNETGGEMVFEEGRWYGVRVEVRRGLLQVWVDGVPVVHLLTRERMLGLRAGMERCAPFGFASYGSEGRVRGVVVRRLAEEIGVSGW